MKKIDSDAYHLFIKKSATLLKKKHVFHISSEKLYFLGFFEYEYMEGGDVWQHRASSSCVKDTKKNRYQKDISCDNLN